MRRLSVALGVLGLLFAAALPARAAEVTLFGKKYNVAMESRAQTYKNGVKITIPDADSGSNRKAGLYFVQGADPSQDRLFVAAPIQATDGLTGDQLYVLRGADANGMFTAASAEATSFFGGNQDWTRGGRPVSVMHISDENTGVKADRNLAVTTFSNDDTYRYYDLDTLSGSYDTDAVYSRVQRAINADEGDPNAPFGGFVAYAPGPNGTIVAFGRAESGSGVEVGVTDPKKNDFFPVLTNMNDVTSNATNAFPAEEAFVHGAALVGDEYWLLVSSSQPDGDNDSTERNTIYRVRLTFPADLTKEARNGIKVEVLGTAELKGTALNGPSEGGMYGLAVGREVNGGRRLYFADWQGNLYTCTPMP